MAREECEQHDTRDDQQHEEPDHPGQSGADPGPEDRSQREPDRYEEHRYLFHAGGHARADGR